MNRATFVGNLGRDPQIRMTKTGKTVATFSIAVTERYNVDGDWKEIVDWFNVVAWGKLAEKAGNQLYKGSKVLVDGRMSTRSYEGKDGRKVYVTELVATTIKVLAGVATQGGGNFEQFGTAQSELPPQNDDLPF